MSKSTAPAWMPGPSPDPHRTCQGCGERVDPGLIRTYGTNDGVIFACLECSNPRHLRNGAGIDPEYVPAEDSLTSTRSGYHPIFGGEDE